MSVTFASANLRQKAPPSQATVQKLLDENVQLIQTITDLQNTGRLADAVQVQQRLHRNLVYLASIADVGQTLMNELQSSELNLQNVQDPKFPGNKDNYAAPNDPAANKENAGPVASTGNPAVSESSTNFQPTTGNPNEVSHAGGFQQPSQVSDMPQHSSPQLNPQMGLSHAVPSQQQAYYTPAVSQQQQQQQMHAQAQPLMQGAQMPQQMYYSAGAGGGPSQIPPGYGQVSGTPVQRPAVMQNPTTPQESPQQQQHQAFYQGQVAGGQYYQMPPQQPQNPAQYMPGQQGFGVAPMTAPGVPPSGQMYASFGQQMRAQMPPGMYAGPGQNPASYQHQQPMGMPQPGYHPVQGYGGYPPQNNQYNMPPPNSSSS